MLPFHCGNIEVFGVIINCQLMKDCIYTEYRILAWLELAQLFVRVAPILFENLLGASWINLNRLTNWNMKHVYQNDPYHAEARYIVF